MEFLDMAHVWTKLNKPTGTSWTKVPKGGEINIVGGDPIGLLLALTYTDPESLITTKWTKQTKASGTSWTKITKAT